MFCWQTPQLEIFRVVPSFFLQWLFRRPSSFASHARAPTPCQTSTPACTPRMWVLGHVASDTATVIRKKPPAAATPDEKLAKRAAGPDLAIPEERPPGCRVLGASRAANCPIAWAHTGTQACGGNVHVMHRGPAVQRRCPGTTALHGSCWNAAP